MRRLASALLLVLGLPLAATAQQHNPAHHQPGEAHEEPTIVIIVRHGERGTEPASDPVLTPAGQERALALLETLRHAKVDVVLHTPRVRTRDTAVPVAQFFGITPEVVPLTPGASHIEAMAAAIRKHAGKTILVVGHSNTIRQYVAALGGPARGDLCDHEYDGLYTVVMIHGVTHVVEGRYGAPNPPPAPGCNPTMAPSMRP